jgi:hypothetical protein
MSALLLMNDLIACRELMETLNTSVVQTWDAEHHSDELSEETGTQRTFAALKARHPATEEGYDVKALRTAKTMIDGAYDISDDFGDEVTDYVRRLEDIRDEGFVGIAQSQSAEKAFQAAWHSEIADRLTEMATNKEVTRAFGRNLDQGKWMNSLEELSKFIGDISTAESLANRAGLRTLLESAWKSKEVGRHGERYNISTMPPKIWNVLQELLDARVILKNSEEHLRPGGVLPPQIYQDLQEADRKRLKGKKPDFFATIDGSPGVGDSANVATAVLEEAKAEVRKTVTDKVSTYKPLPTIVVVGVHNAPGIVGAEVVSELKTAVQALHDKPAKVYVVCGASSQLVYP